ncbi:MAG: 3'(2'),5'-bisphosphate nucleotidase CysQ [Calditrichaeota bacterium]|nr:3'(2'),5'-bisphosphate nucleotidase CysQ [Calditrichota bacterium]
MSLEAGNAIMEVYQSGDFNVEIKDDNSPLTRADSASHEIIKARLQEKYPEIPLMSEEGKEIPDEQRKNWEIFWLVDPLDGTKEFIKRNGEFTVNIALIRNNYPVLGVIFAPVLNTLYFGEAGKGCYKQLLGEKASPIHVADGSADGVIAVKSRSHSSEDEEKVLRQWNIVDTINKGSSLKFCMVAEGKAHIYYRHGPTWEWDTGAGQAIVEAAGGTVTANGERLRYNKQIIKNGSFLVKNE